MATRTQRVVFETDRNRVVGDLILPEEGYRSRLSDLLNQQGLAFVPLTDAEVMPLDGGPAQAHAFLAVARDHIQLAYEQAG
jgi:uncharacterized protein DUF6812